MALITWANACPPPLHSEGVHRHAMGGVVARSHASASSQEGVARYAFQATFFCDFIISPGRTSCGTRRPSSIWTGHARLHKSAHRRAQ